MSLNISVKKTFPSFVVECKNVGDVKKIINDNNLTPRYKMPYIISDGDKKRFILSEDIKELPEVLKKTGLDIELNNFEVELDHKNFSLREILENYIPSDVRIPSSFETIGHIAHLNLTDSQLPYKNIIGQAILLKNPFLKTVVTKASPINNVYRNMELEVIAGENNLLTEVRQDKFVFKMDFSKVYWNSRLQREHESLVSTFREGSFVCDSMCGIGPFAVRAAKLKNCKVHANDLNPDSFYWLKENTRINKCEDMVTCFNLDAREFIKNTFKNGGCDYIVMNLPATAIEFLDQIAESAKEHHQTASMPIVHFHCFDDKDGSLAKESIQARADKHFGTHIPELSIVDVRDVSPGKNMFRCTFDLSLMYDVDHNSPTLSK